jgi:hypothetical protein
MDPPGAWLTKKKRAVKFEAQDFLFIWSSLNGVVVALRKRGLMTLVWQTNLGKEATRNPERESPNSTRLLLQCLLFDFLCE